MEKAVLVPLSKIKPRKKAVECNNDVLEASIREFGILCPITLDHNFVIMDGSRRYDVAVKRGMTEIPAIVLKKPVEEPTALEIKVRECRELYIKFGFYDKSTQRALRELFNYVDKD